MSATTVAVKLLAGLIFGYLTISVCESFFHRTIQHAGVSVRLWYAKAGALGRALLNAWYAHHVVHHFLTCRRNHVTQFSCDEERAKLDQHLSDRGLADIIACRYGVALGKEFKSYAQYMAPTMPIFVVLCYFGGGWFTVGACIPLCIWPMLAQCIHPYLHMRYARVLHHGPRPISWLARTRYFRYLARYHWLHHRYTNCNYNLLVGGDRLLCVHRAASEEDLEEMRSIGLAVPQECVREAKAG